METTNTDGAGITLPNGVVFVPEPNGAGWSNAQASAWWEFFEARMQERETEAGRGQEKDAADAA